MKNVLYNSRFPKLKRIIRKTETQLRNTVDLSLSM